MDASILIVGDKDFLTTLQQPLQDLVAATVEIAPNPSEAIPLIHAQQPDILVVQANQMGALDLCRQIKSQSRLAWIYCILLELQPQISESERVEQTQTKDKVEALEAGADAYFWITLSVSSNGIQDGESVYLQNCLVSAQIQAGLRRVKNYRELMRTNDLLSAIALTDPLTELNNRRAFEWELPRQIHNARFRKVPISLIILDVDYFKTVNDTYGHLVGDRVLQLLSARLRHNLRFYDTPFRYGGEEFVIILSDTNSKEATLIAHRLCRLIGEQPFVIDSQLDLTITISAGATSLLPEDDVRGINLLQRADQNLLKAKSQGRNCVIGDGG
jgi:two-component system cell cycle response regulator